MLGKVTFFIACAGDWHGAQLPPHGPHPSAASEKRKFWVGQGRSRSDRFVPLSKEVLPGAGERMGVNPALGEGVGEQRAAILTVTDRPVPASATQQFLQAVSICRTRTFHQLKKC